MESNPKIIRGGNNISSLIFHIIYIILLLSILFFLYVSIAPFITLGLFLIIPLLFPTKNLKWRFFIFLGLIIPFVILNGMLVNYVDAAGLVIFLYPIPVLITIVISHYLLRYVREKAGNMLKVTGIIVMLILILLLIIFSIIKINNLVIDHENYILSQEIHCKGAYTTTSPQELERLCNEIQVGGNKEENYNEFKSYCLNLVEKIRADKYYFDYYDYPVSKFGVRNPRNYQDCDDKIYELRNFKLNQNSERKVESKIIEMGGRPEVLDPNLCDVYSEMDHELLKKVYVLKTNANENDIEIWLDGCYENLASFTGNVELCKKVRFPHSCYRDVAKERKDPTICDNIQINYRANIDEEYIEKCKEQAK